MLTIDEEPKQDLRTQSDLRTYWRIFRRRIWFIAVPFLCVTLIAIPGSFLMTPLYQATTTLVLKPSGASLLQGFLNLRISVSARLDATSEMMKSYDYLRQVSDQLGIARDLQQNGAVQVAPQDAVNYLRQITTVRSRGDTVIEVSVLHRDPSKAADIANNVASVYLDKVLRSRQQNTSRSYEFISNQMELYRRNLSEAEDALYKAYETGAVEWIEKRDNERLIKDAAQVDALLIQTELKLQRAQWQMQRLREKVRSSSYKDPQVAAAEAVVSSLKVQLDQLLSTYTDEYPAVVGLKRQISEAEEALRQAKSRSTSGVENVDPEIYALEQKIAALTLDKEGILRKRAEYDRKISSLPAQQVGLARLERERGSSQRIYDMLLGKLAELRLLEASIAGGMVEDVELQDPAFPPQRPAKPDRMKIGFLAAMLGTMLGFGTGLMAEYFDHSIKNVEDVWRYLNLRVVGIVPPVRTREDQLMRRRRLKVALVVILLVILAVTADLLISQFIERQPWSIALARLAKTYIKALLTRLRGMLS